MHKFKPLLDYHTPWLCYRSTKNSNLVYFSCNKCASTFYDAFFERLNWKKITTADINWSDDFVFSYIRDPLVRHRKGIVEGIFTCYPEMKQVFIETPQRFNFLANITSVEAHSYSIHRMLGYNATKIYWIPIDTDLDHRQHTLEILAKHNEIVDYETANQVITLDNANRSTVEELDFYNRLANIKTPPEILRYLDFDICLYKKSTTPPPHIFAKEFYATRIQELLEQGLSQEEAEKIVDVEAYNTNNIDRK